MRVVLPPYLLLLLATALASSEAVAPAQPVERHDGDWVIDRAVTISDRQVLVAGNLRIVAGGHLTLERCTLELVSTYSRQFRVYIAGGQFTTRGCTLGGSMHEGRMAHTNFEFDGGHWDLCDCEIRICYGITFSEKNGGVLRAERLRAGKNSDSIIVGGRADVEVRDSTYPISLHLPGSGGGVQNLHLPGKEQFSARFDQTTIPGVAYRLLLERHVVPGLWFLFFTNVSMNGAATRIRISGNEHTRLLPAFMGGPLSGRVALPTHLGAPVTLGCVTLEAAPGPAPQVPMWSLYLSGNGDLTVTGPSSFAEIMLWGRAKLTFEGSAQGHDIHVLATTIDLKKQSRLTLRRCTIGLGNDGVTRQGNRAQITSEDASLVVLESCRLGDLLLIHQHPGAIQTKDCDERGTLERRTHGASPAVDALQPQR